MRKALLGVVIVFGLGAASLSLLVTLILAALALFGGQEALLAAAVLLFSLLTAGLGLGGGTAWTAWRSLSDRPSPRLRLPASWLLLLAFGLVLVLGMALRATPAAVLLLPPIHVVASLLPPLILIAAVANPLRRAGVHLSRRDLVLQLGYGALGAALLAAFLEGVTFTAAIVGGVVLAALLPGGLDALEQLNQLLQSPELLADPQVLLEQLLSPAFILAAGLMLALLGPALEEFVKSLGVALSGLARGRLSRGRAFALGVMAGTGFSLVEALFNGAALLPDSWAGPVLLRAGTVVIHGLATGLMGLGWQALLVRRSRPGFLGYSLASIAVHGAWNGLSGLLAVAGITFMGGGFESVTNAGLALVAGGLLVVLFMASLAAMGGLTTVLAREASQARGDERS